MISLKASNIKEFISNLLLHVEIGVLFEDEDGIIQYTNPKLHEVLSIPIPPEVMVGMNCMETAIQSKNFWADPDVFIHRINEINDRAEVVKGEELITADGRFIIRDYVPLKEEGLVKGRLWIYRDISDQRNAEFSLKSTMNSIKDVVWSIDLAQNRFLYLSPSASTVFRLPVDEMYRDASVWKTCLSTSDAERLDLEFKHLLEDEQKTQAELVLKYIHPEHQISWIRVSAKKILNANGIPYRLDGLVTDVTEEIRSKLELQSSRFQLEGITNTLLNYINTGNSRKSLPLLLDNILELTGSQYGFMGEILFDDNGSPYLKSHAITDIAWSEETRRYYQAYVEEGIEFRNLNTLFGVTLKDQVVVISNDPKNDPRSGGLPHGHPPMSSYIGIPFFKNEEIIGMLGLANRPGGYTEEIADQLKPILVTASSIIENYRHELDRKRIQIEVAESEQRWRLAIEGTQEGIWDLDFKNKKMFFSEYCDALFGEKINVEQGFSSILDKIAPRDQVQLKRLYTIIQSGKMNGSVINGEIEVFREKQSSVWLQWRGAILRDDQQNVVRITGSLTDISKKKQAEEEISKALLKQENLNQLRSRFVTMASHEFKSPLTTIQTSSDLIDMVLVNDHLAEHQKVSKYTQRIRTQVRRLNNILNDILVLGRLEAQQMPLKSEWIDLSLLMKDLLDQITHMSDDTRTLEIVNKAKNTQFWADYNLIMHLLLNLISNAFKYSVDAPAPILRLNSNKDWMLFEVQDFGIGMSELDMSNMFSPFYRSERVENTKGYGLGLVLVKEIVDLHKGMIEVNSELGKGSSICIKIPMR
jgi:PAS domain S-box-containing protein